MNSKMENLFHFPIFHVLNVFPLFFHSLYSRAAKEKHIVLLSVRLNGGM